MIGTHQPSGLAAAFQDAGQPMLANIGEGADALLVADREDRFVGDLECDELAVFVEFVLAADAVPLPAKYPLDLKSVEAARRIGPRRHRQGVLKRTLERGPQRILHVIRTVDGPFVACLHAGPFFFF